MAKFKVGDRVRCVNAQGQIGTTNGTIYEVREVPVDEDGVIIGCDDGVLRFRFDDRFELVEPLKLEKGAIVRLKDGVDEWEVTNVNGNSALVARGTVSTCVFTSDIVVVKAKPEPPKPDYYVNCKGAEPKHGDVFCDEDGAAAYVRRDEYVWISGGGASYPLRGGHQHAVGNPHTARTLVVRDGKPYTG